MTHQFRYLAVTRSGQRLSGVETAGSASEVMERLQARRMFVLDVSVRRPTRLHAAVRLLWRARASPKALAIATGELATLVNADLTVDRALDIVETRTTDHGFRDALRRVHEAVRRGEPFSEALAREPETFSPLYAALVQAGEVSGQLGAALMGLHNYLQRRDTLTQRVRNALIYPAFLTVTAIGSLTLLSDVVLPQFIPLFHQSGKSLPFITRAVIVGNDIIGSLLPILAVAMLVGAFILVAIIRNESGRASLHGALLRVPVIGTVWQSLDAARIARAAGTLLSGGASVVTALELGMEAATNRALRQAGGHAIERIREGALVTDAFSEAKVFPPLSHQLLAVGEETGKLEVMLMKQADLLEESAERRISSLLSLLVPSMTLGIGALVGCVLAAVMLAVVQLNEIVG